MMSDEYVKLPEQVWLNDIELGRRSSEPIIGPRYESFPMDGSKEHLQSLIDYLDPNNPEIVLSIERTVKWLWTIKARSAVLRGLINDAVVKDECMEWGIVIESTAEFIPLKNIATEDLSVIMGKLQDHPLQATNNHLWQINLDAVGREIKNRL